MQMRHDPFAGVAAPETPLRARPPLDEARVAPLTARLSALWFDRPAPAGRRPRLSGRLDGAPVAPPSIGAALPLRAGGVRHLLLVGRPLAEILAARVELALDGAAQAGSDPRWLQPPLHGLPALVAGLAPAGRAQLLKLMLTTGASLFGAAGEPELAALARQLLDLCAVPKRVPEARAGFGSAHTVLTCAHEGAAAGPATAVAVEPDRLTALGSVDLLAEPDVGRLHLHLSGRPLHPAEIVVFTPDPLRLLADLRPQPLARWLEGRGGPVKDWALGRVRAAAAEDAAAAALLRELRHADLPVRLQVLALQAAPGGLLYGFRIADPEGLVRAVRIEAGDEEADIRPAIGPDGGAVLAGLAPVEPADSVRVQLVLGSGRLRLAAEIRPTPWRGEVPPGFVEAWEEARLNGDGTDPAEILAAALATLPAEPLRLRVQGFGAPAAVDLSLIAPMGGNPDLIATRAAALAAEPDAGRAELILTVPEGPLAVQARGLAAGAAAVYGIACRVVAHPADASPGAVLGATAALVPGAALVIGADVMPAASGWLAAWRARLREADVVAGALLDHQGAIVAAGSHLAGDRIVRPLEGLEAARLTDAGTTVLVPADCTGLSAAGVARLVSAASSQPDADLALTALGPAHIPVFAGHPFIRFAAPVRPAGFAEALTVHGLRRILQGKAR